MAKKGQLSERYGGSMQALTRIIRTEGVYGLYRAYWIHQATWCPVSSE